MKDFIKAGTDVRNLRKPLNELARRVPREIITEGAVSNYDGDRLSFSALGEELYWIRLESKTGTTPIKYAFTVMQHDRTADTWIASPITGSTSDNTYAVELNNASVTTGDGKRHRARVDQSSGRWIFDQGGTGGGTQDIKGKDILILVLGTYDEYSMCPGVPPDPPKKPNGEFCEPPYAWAAYKPCGYGFEKLFDMVGFGAWGVELNGQTTSSWRRLHPGFWGWDTYSDGQPTGNEACAAARFLKVDVPALTCTCPTWLSDIPCIKLKFKTVPRPCAEGYCGMGCNTFIDAMDGAAAWDKEFSVTLCNAGGCNFSGSAAPFIFNFVIEEIPRGGPDCFFGPEFIDPCFPCDGFYRIKIDIGWDAFYTPTLCDGVDSETGFRGYWNLLDFKDAFSAVPCDEVFAYKFSTCNGCVITTTPPSHFAFIDPDTVRLTCCTQAEIDACNGV